MTTNRLVPAADQAYREGNLPVDETGYESRNANFQSLWYVLDLPIFIITPGAYILASNPAARLMYRFSEKTSSTPSFLDMFPAPQKEGLKKAIDLARSDQAATYLGTMVSRKQTTLPVDIVLKSGLWNQKNVVFCFCYDLRDRSELEDRVDQLQRQLDEVLGTMASFQYTLSIDKNGKVSIKHLSPSAAMVTGYSLDQAVSKGKDWLNFVHPEDRKKVSDFLKQRMLGWQKDPFEYRMLQPDNTTHWVQDDLGDRRIQSGKVLLSGFVNDITDRKRAEEIRQQTNEQLLQRVSELKQRSSEAVLLNEMGDLLHSALDLDDVLMVVRRFALELFSELSGVLYLLNAEPDLLESTLTWGNESPEMRDFRPKECWGLRRNQIVSGGMDRQDIVCKHVATQGCSSYLCVPMTVQTETLGLLHLCSSTESSLDHLTQLALTFASRVALAISNLRLSETLRQQSIRDPLTGLYNRRYLEEMLTRELRRSIRHQRPIGIIMADIDHFKDFNDQFGHAAGDLVLKEVAKFLQEQIRGEDIICRYGGEEFIVVLVEASLKDTEKRANLLRQGIEALTLDYGEVTLGSVTVSFGVSAYPQHGETFETLIETADNALYRAKHAGRNCVFAAE